ncbi:MAG: hypothetical protein RMJ67_10130, partial [Elusimicrobiota bacterium]|nr:hypothetical protein [Endomicrobiia bacterium]MDW8166849.1 hypothetical protein [Elusimicrobiota bacterium]
NVYGYGNGYTFIKHKQYLQWKSYKYSTERVNWFILGFTEENRTFLKNIKNMKKSTMRRIIFSENTDEAKKIVWKFLTGHSISRRDILQGDLLLKYRKNINGEIEKIGEEEKEYKLRNHIVRGKFIVEGDVIYVKDACLIHHQHNVKYIPEGVYQAIFQRDFYLWNFSRIIKD